MHVNIKGVLNRTKIVTSFDYSSYIVLDLDDLSITDENENEIYLDDDDAVTAWPSDMKFIENFSLRKVSLLDVEEVNSIICSIFLRKKVLISATTRDDENGTRFYMAKEIILF